MSTLRPGSYRPSPDGLEAQCAVSANGVNDKTLNHPICGNITGSFCPFPKILDHLGHSSTTLTALKLDCEGRGFAAFQDLAKSNTRIRQMDVENSILPRRWAWWTNTMSRLSPDPTRIERREEHSFLRSNRSQHCKSSILLVRGVSGRGKMMNPLASTNPQPKVTLPRGPPQLPLTRVESSQLEFNDNPAKRPNKEIEYSTATQAL